jgi:hypothetical protein
LKRIARGKIQIAVPVRKRGASIQASFRGQNLTLKSFLEGPETVLEDLALERHSYLENKVPMIKG